MWLIKFNWVQGMESLLLSVLSLSPFSLDSQCSMKIGHNLLILLEVPLEGLLNGSKNRLIIFIFQKQHSHMKNLISSRLWSQ